MRRGLWWALWLMVSWAGVAQAQGTVAGDRFKFNTGPCYLRSGAGSPEGAVVGAVCDTYWRTDTGQVYYKTSGTGNTGWTLSTLAANLSGGTTGSLPYQTGAGATTFLGIGAAGTWLTSTGSAPSWASPAALTKVDDTNVTLTLGGSHAASLLNAASLTVGWTGLLSVPRGGSGVASVTAGRVLFGAGTDPFASDADLTFSDDTLAATKATVGDTFIVSSAGDIGTFNLASFVSKSPNATRYSTSFFVDQDTATVNWLNYDSTGAAYIAEVHRGLSYDFKATVTADNFEVRGNLLPETAYVSNLGSIPKKFLTVHAAELLVETLVAQDVMATIGGRIVVAPTTTLTVPVATGDVTITVKHNNLASGDILRLEANGHVEFMQVSAACTGSGPYICTVTRNLDGTGLNAWAEGDAVLNTGTTGDGVIDLFSTSGMLSGAGPTIMGSVRTGATYSALSPRWAIGELNGLYDYTTSTYGFAAGDKDGAWVKVDATNGVRIGHDAATKIQIEPDGDAMFAGAITAASGTIADWTIAPTALYTASGSGAGLSSTDYPFFAGAAYASRATAPFRVTNAGAVTATSGAVGGWALGATSLADAAGTVGLSSAVTGGDDIRFWAGHATPASAPFRVSEAGVLTATNASIKGAIEIGPTASSQYAQLGASDSALGTMLNLTAAAGISTSLVWSPEVRVGSAGAGYQGYVTTTLYPMMKMGSFSNITSPPAVFIDAGAIGTLMKGGLKVGYDTAATTKPGDGTITAASTITGSGFIAGSDTGLSRTCNPAAGNMTFVGGIMTACTAAEPSPAPDALARLLILEQRIAALEAVYGGR